MGQLRKLPARRAGPTGAGRRIYDLVRGQIADGSLPPGARAPSTRVLAAELGVSRTTVTAAYEQLAAEGFLVTSAGRAARVAGRLLPAAAPATKRKAGRRAPLSAFGRTVEKMVLSALQRACLLYTSPSPRDS